MNDTLIPDFNLFVDLKNKASIENITAEIGLSGNIRPVTEVCCSAGKHYRFEVKDLPNLGLFSMMLGYLVSSSIQTDIEIRGQLIAVPNNLAGAAQIITAMEVAFEDISSRPARRRTGPLRAAHL